MEYLVKGRGLETKIVYHSRREDQTLIFFYSAIFCDFSGTVLDCKYFDTKNLSYQRHG